MTVVPPRRTRCARALPVTVCAAAMVLAACGTSHPPPPGTPVVTMSNLTNSSDFISYIINIDAIEPVGVYAVKLAFSDGHDTGIYSWDYLYDLGERQEANWKSYLARLAQAGASRDK